MLKAINIEMAKLETQMHNIDKTLISCSEKLSS